MSEGKGEEATRSPDIKVAQASAVAEYERAITALIPQRQDAYHYSCASFVGTGVGTLIHPELPPHLHSCTKRARTSVVINQKAKRDYSASALSTFHYRVEFTELDASVLGRELPIDPGEGGVAPMLPGVDVVTLAKEMVAMLPSSRRAGRHYAQAALRRQGA